MLEQLEAAAARSSARMRCRVVLLTGEGEKAFCAGADIADWGALDPLEFGRRWVGEGHRIFDRWARLRQPVIAVLNGIAFGGGPGARGHGRPAGRRGARAGRPARDADRHRAGLVGHAAARATGGPERGQAADLHRRAGRRRRGAAAGSGRLPVPEGPGPGAGARARGHDRRAGAGRRADRQAAGQCRRGRGRGRPPWKPWPVPSPPPPRMRRKAWPPSARSVRQPSGPVAPCWRSTHKELLPRAWLLTKADRGPNSSATSLAACGRRAGECRLLQLGQGELGC